VDDSVEREGTNGVLGCRCRAPRPPSHRRISTFSGAPGCSDGRRSSPMPPSTASFVATRHVWELSSVRPPGPKHVTGTAGQSDVQPGASTLEAEIVDLSSLAVAASGVQWTLGEPGDLNVNSSASPQEAVSAIMTTLTSMFCSSCSPATGS